MLLVLIKYTSFLQKKLLILGKFKGFWYKKVYSLKLHMFLHLPTKFKVSSLIIKGFTHGRYPGRYPFSHPAKLSNKQTSLIMIKKLGTTRFQRGTTGTSLKK